MVGTSILAPSPASVTVIGTRISMLSPSRWNTGCGSTRMRDVEIARRHPHGARVAFAGDPQARAVLRAGRNAHLDRFVAQHAPVAVAGGADALQLARAPQRGQVEVEFHRPRHLASRYPVPSHCGQVTDAATRSRFRAMAGFANFLMVDVQADLRAADGLPEIDAERILEIGARARRWALRRPGRLRLKNCENRSLEIRRPLPGRS